MDNSDTYSSWLEAFPKFTNLLKNIEKEIISQGYTTTFVDLNDFPIPFYNEDIELKGLPSNVFMLKNIIFKFNINI